MAFWVAQLDRLERGRRRLVWVPIVGLAVAATSATVHPLLGGGGVTITLLIWLNGLTNADAARAACEAQLHSLQHPRPPAPA